MPQPLAEVLLASADVAPEHLPGTRSWRAVLGRGRSSCAEQELTCRNLLADLEITEQALEEAEERFATAFHSNATPLLIVSRDGARIVNANASWLTLFGFEREETLGWTAAELGIEIDAALAQDVGYVRDRELLLRRATGEQLHIQSNVHPITMLGVGDCLLITCIDITARRDAEGAFAATFAHSPVGMLISRAGGPMLEVNAQLLRLFGYTRAELVGHLVADLGLISAATLAALAVTIEAHGSLPPTEVELRRRDGSVVTVLASTETITHCGERCRLSVFVDITERKRAERRLALQNEICRELLEADDLAAVAPGILERLGREEGWSATSLWLVDAQHTRTCVAAWGDEGTADPIISIPIVRRGEILGALDVVMASAQPLDATTRKLLESVSKVLGLFMERTQSASSNRDLEAFNYSISHELRAPLRAINGFAEILAEDHGGELSPPARELLGKIQSSGTRLRSMVDDLLAFARLGRAAVRRRPFDLAALVAEVAAQVEQDRAEDRRIELRIGTLHAAPADPALLRQVWVNLLDNAFKYTRDRDPAVIEVSSEVIGGEVRYQVRDNGAGFDGANAERLFGVFQRMHRATEFEGTGVGLAHVRRIVERHGGHVSAESRAGEGATFQFTLPLEG